MNKRTISLRMAAALLTLLVLASTASAQINPSPAAVLSQLQVEVTLLAPADTAGWSDMERAALPRAVTITLNSSGNAPNINVRLGSQPGLSDLGLRTFPQGVLGALPNGSSIAPRGASGGCAARSLARSRLFLSDGGQPIGSAIAILLHRIPIIPDRAAFLSLLTSPIQFTDHETSSPTPHRCHLFCDGTGPDHPHMGW
jgi:hypothetical protein